MRNEPVKTKTGISLDTLIRYSGGTSLLSAGQRRRPVGAVWNDSRKVGIGDVFVAIETENDDGHRFVKNALAQGAALAIVARKKTGMFSDEDKKRLVAVRDPLTSLQAIAARYRKTLECEMIGITGSSGKTTARSFIAAVLKQKLVVGETLGNFNNHIGVPLSLLRFTGKENAGVLEMGANHKREIHVLSNIVRPDIGVITNIGYAHIGYFGSLANILKAKFEIIDGMRKNGLLLLNGDDPLLVRRAATAQQNVVFFGMSGLCDYRAENIRLTKNGHMAFTSFTVQGEQYEIPMPGRHFVYNALAAIAVAREFGIHKKNIDAAFASLSPLSMRGAIRKKAGATFIVDCYNANPSSMESGIALLSDVANLRRQPKVAIVGDMLELGRYSAALHTALGKQLAAAGVDRILAVGSFASKVAQGARAAGMKMKKIMTARTSADAIPIARKFVRRGDTVLLKGSRGIHLETVLEGL
jgi:UDP-N-acetylmuramoyl-tripeptide--D-alanyl-D-alanine ligase